MCLALFVVDDPRFTLFTLFISDVRLPSLCDFAEEFRATVVVLPEDCLIDFTSHCVVVLYRAHKVFKLSVWVLDLKVALVHFCLQQFR